MSEKSEGCGCVTDDGNDVSYVNQSNLVNIDFFFGNHKKPRKISVDITNLWFILDLRNENLAANDWVTP